jgi:acetyl esterase/lipase
MRIPQVKTTCAAVWLAVSLTCGACAKDDGMEHVWTSSTTGGELSYTVITPKTAQAAASPVIIYLKNLAAERVGSESDDSIIADFAAGPNIVVVLDYAKHPKARVPYLNHDIYKLRSDIYKKLFMNEYSVDKSHVFIVPEGCRLMRDVKYYQDDDRTLGMDIIYPSKPKRPIGTIMEFSCDNKDRMGTYSLVFCSDTILEAGASGGFVAAMADHPVAPPYKGLDPMPDCACKTKAAVRTLRAAISKLGTNGKIGVVGFSRGSGMALLLAATNGRSQFDGKGENVDLASDVQAAVVMSGRFTYLDLLADDKMIPRYEQAWGTRKEHEDTWRMAGAMEYMDKGVAPLFLTINKTEAPEALHQMDVLRKRLDSLGVRHTYMPEDEGRGHKMPMDEKVLTGIYGFFDEHLGQSAEKSPSAR